MDIGSVANKLSTKLRKREHMAAGSRILSGRICGHYPADCLELHVPQLFCPLCYRWPRVVGHAGAGEALLPSRTGRKVRKVLHEFGRAPGWTRARRLGTQAFYGGAAGTITGAGGSLARLMTSDRRHASAHRLNLVLGREELHSMASTLVGPSDEESVGTSRPPAQ